MSLAILIACFVSYQVIVGNKTSVQLKAVLITAKHLDPHGDHRYTCAQLARLASIIRTARWEGTSRKDIDTLMETMVITESLPIRDLVGRAYHDIADRAYSFEPRFLFLRNGSALLQVEDSISFSDEIRNECTSVFR